MLKTTLAGLRAHSARLIFSSLAIILGVGFAAGSFVLTDTIKVGYEMSFAADARLLDLVATPDDDGDAKAVPAATVERMRDVDGVASVEERYQGYGTLLNSKGRPLGNQGMASVDSVAADKELRWQQVAKGRLPDAADELTLDAATAKRAGYAVGDSVRVIDVEDEVHTYTLTGTIDVEDSPQYAGIPYVGVTAAQAKLINGADAPSRIDMRLADGADAAAVESDVAALLPSGWKASTSAEFTRQQLKQISGELTQVNIALLAFAAIAMFVAAIVIANTFTILIAQRTREMALLRCVGATRGQVYRSVLLESIVLGIVGSALGLLAGIGLAAVAQVVLRAVGAPMGSGPVSPTVVGLVIPFVLGTVVTVVAAAFPAIGATRIAPIAALRNQPDIGKVRKSHRVRTVFAFLALLAGVAAMVPGVRGDGSEQNFLLALAGGGVAFLGILFLTPVIVPRLISAVGFVVARPFRTPGRLARANAVRNPGRAAATSAALLVGVTLISIMAVVSSSVQKTATASLDEEFPFDLSITSRTAAVPGSVVADLEREKRLAGVVPVYTARGTVGDGRGFTVQGVDKAETKRELGALKQYEKAGPGKVVIPKYIAAAEKLEVGDQVTIGLAGDKELTAEVAGTLSGDTAIATSDDLLEAAPDAVIGSVFLKAKSGESADDVQTAVDRAVADRPELTVEGPLQYKAAIEKGVQTTLLLFAGLLGIAVLIALFGIANTLALSVLERTRESGVLRALGLTRRQLRAMFSGEAVLMAAVAGLLGVGLGVAFGYVAIRSLVGSSAELVAPYAQLGLFVGLAALAGLVASVVPARKAARSSVVVAMAEE